MLYALAIGGLAGLLSFFLFPKKSYRGKRSIVLRELHETCLLRQGPVCAILLRQSGNTYRELGNFADPLSACTEIEKSLRKAQIDTVVVWQNNEKIFEVHRRIYSGRGSSEGKKLGGAMIVAI